MTSLSISPRAGSRGTSLKPGQKKQKGSLLFDLLVGAAILAVVIIGFIVITNQRAAASEQSRAVAVIVERVPAALTSVYYNNNRSYAALSADAAGKTILTNEGVEVNLPWGAAWTISTAGTAGGVVILDFPCAGARAAATMCSNLVTAINAAGNGMVTAVANASNTLSVTYGRPV